MVGYDAELRDNDIPFLAIPTTSGTGSEATRYSIFYVNEDEKHSVSHPGFLPGYVLLDPCFCKRYRTTNASAPVWTPCATP